MGLDDLTVFGTLEITRKRMWSFPPHIPPPWSVITISSQKKERKKNVSFILLLIQLVWLHSVQTGLLFCDQFSSVTQSCLTLCNPMDCSTPGFPILHQLPELAQTHVHRVSDAIQPSHPLSFPSPAFTLSQHQCLFQWVSSLHIFCDSDSVCALYLLITLLHYIGLPWWFSGKEPTCKCRRPGFNPWIGKIPWRRKWQPTWVFLPGKSHGQRSLVGYSPWGCKRIGHDLNNWTKTTRHYARLRNAVFVP